MSTAYSQGLSGLQNFLINGVSRTLNFQTFNNKGWVEILILADVPYGLQTTTAFYDQPGADYLLKEANVVNGGLDYTSDHSFVSLGSGFSATDILFTSKSSRASSSIVATGYNENSALPLVASSDLYSNLGGQVSVVTGALTDYFTANGPGFSSFYTQAQGPNQYAASWSKASYEFGILLHSRGGGPQTDHWMVASGQSGATSTYHPNIGFRGTTSGSSYSGKHVGSWADSTVTKSGTAGMSSTNVFSVWVTNM